jgi:uncharacterized membrane protein
MLRIALAIFTGLIGAALLHLIIVLAVPHFSNRDAYTRSLAEGPANTFHLLKDTRDKAALGSGDPFMKVAVCTFDIEEMPLRLTAFGNVPFWSIAIYDSASNEVFSMNDRTSAEGVMDILVATPVQLSTIRKAQPAALAQAILTSSVQTEGYAVLRTMTPQSSFVQEAETFLDQAKCEPFQWQ